MQFACNILPNYLAQTPFIRRVYILVYTGMDLKLPILPFFQNLLEPSLDFLEFFLREDAILGIRSCICDAATNILRIENSIEVDRLVVLGHYGIETAGEATTPELACCGRSVLSGHLCVNFRLEALYFQEYLLNRAMSCERDFQSSTFNVKTAMSQGKDRLEISKSELGKPLRYQISECYPKMYRYRNLAAVISTSMPHLSFCLANFP